jgi:antitoxin component YwqK of YwqJK toxin-antitoxin module
MKSFFVITLALFFAICFSCSTDTKQNNSSDPQNIAVDTVLKIKKKSIKNPDGKYTEVYPSGIKKMEGNHAKGKRTGIWMAWYENGMLWSQGYYLHGMRHGFSALYYSNGRVRAEGAYRHDKRSGTWSFFSEDGKLIKEVNYDQGIEIKTENP